MHHNRVILIAFIPKSSDLRKTYRIVPIVDLLVGSAHARLEPHALPNTYECCLSGLFTWTQIA